MQAKTYYYLMSPYAHSDPTVRQARVNATTFVAAQFIRQHIPVYAPIVHGHALLPYADLPTTHEFWLGLDRNFVRGAMGSISLNLPGWIQSNGMAQEAQWFQSNLGFQGRVVSPRLDDIAWYHTDGDLKAEAALALQNAVKRCIESQDFITFTDLT